MNTVTLGDENGPALTLLHGWGANIELVRPLGERMAALGYRVVMFDLPGFGQTPPPPEAWTVFDYAARVAEALREMKIARTHLFGHSFGGRLGLILGADYAELTDKIVLADAAGMRPPTAWGVQARTRAYKAVRGGLNRIGLRGLSDSLRKAYSARYGSADFNAAHGVMRETFVKVVNQDLREQAKRVKAPTLLLWGDRDEDTPISAGREMERLIPDAGLVVFEGAGHYSYLERAADAARIMHTFFKN